MGPRLFYCFRTALAANAFCVSMARHVRMVFHAACVDTLLFICSMSATFLVESITFLNWSSASHFIFHPFILYQMKCCTVNGNVLLWHLNTDKFVLRKTTNGIKTFVNILMWINHVHCTNVNSCPLPTILWAASREVHDAKCHPNSIVRHLVWLYITVTHKTVVGK